MAGFSMSLTPLPAFFTIDLVSHIVRATTPPTGLYGIADIQDIRNKAPYTSWLFNDRRSLLPSAIAFIAIAPEELLAFRNKVTNIIISSGSTTFQKIANRWNAALLGLASYFREAVSPKIATTMSKSIAALLIKSENRVQNRIKASLNSKMPTRFPPVVFYAPREIGGLGMLSAGYSLLEASGPDGIRTFLQDFHILETMMQLQFQIYYVILLHGLKR